MSEADLPKAKKFRRRSEARPNELLEAALDLFAEKGFASTRLADVGRRAGVSPGTVCVYFPTKEALFMAVIKRFLQPVIVDQQAILTEHGTARQRLQRLLEAKAESLRRPRLSALVKLIIAEIGSFPVVGRDFYDNVIEPSLQQVGQLIDEGIANGEFRQVDARLHAHLLIDPLPFAVIWKECYGHLETHPTEPGVKMAAHIDLGLRALDRVPSAGTAP